jgi:hypothetical protein
MTKTQQRTYELQFQRSYIPYSSGGNRMLGFASGVVVGHMM